ncbi:MAG: hypothetical protein H6Q73_2739 [Firmicutes bacterium]|nr:hypothetical protein [Bacillota bacterium]
MRKKPIGKMLAALVVFVGLGLHPLTADALPTADEADAMTTADLYQDGGSYSADGESYDATNADESAIYAKNGGVVTLTNATISSSSVGSSEDACALWGVDSAVLANGGTITITGGSITTKGTYGNGAFATNGGTLSISGTADEHFTITAEAAHGHGIDVTNGGIVNLKYVDIITYGQTGSAVASDNVGTDTLNYVSVDNCNLITYGLGSAGVYVDDHGVFTVTNSTLSSANDEGAVVTAGGILYLTDCDTSGLSAFKMHCTNEQIAGTAVISGGSLTSTSGAAILYDKAIGSITVENGTTITSANGVLVDVSNSSAAYFTAIDETLTGSIITDDTSSLAVDLQDTTLTGATSGAVALTMDSSSLWNINADSTLSSFSNSNGSVTFSSPSASGAYYALTTTGDLSGSGIFNMNVNLGTAQSNLITVGGTASGSYQMYFTSQDSSSILSQAVKVVDLNDDVTNTATFSGGGDLGAYRYAVTQGSALASTYSGVDSSDYYLYNTYTPSTPAYAAIATSAESVVTWYGEMNEIKKRMGELRMGCQSGDDFWVRTYATHYKVKPSGGQTIYQTMKGMEIGKDNATSFSDGKKFAGFVVGGGTADNTFSSGGSGTTDSVYVGAYGSWLKDDGAYFDLIGKYNRFSHDFTSPLYGGGSDSANYNKNGFGLSAEIGKHIERGDGVFVEPQAELSTLWTGKADYTSANGLVIESLSSSSLQLRLGGMIGKKTSDCKGGSREVYGKLSWVHEFDGDSQTVVNEATFDSSLKGSQVVAGVGFIADTGSHQVYLDVEKSWGSSTSKLWGANLGCRWKL